MLLHCNSFLFQVIVKLINWIFGKSFLAMTDIAFITASILDRKLKTKIKRAEGKFKAASNNSLPWSCPGRLTSLLKVTRWNSVSIGSGETHMFSVDVFEAQGVRRGTNKMRQQCRLLTCHLLFMSSLSASQENVKLHGQLGDREGN